MLGDTQGKRQYDYIEDYVVFDLETTGIYPQSDRIIEISAIKVRGGKEIDTFSTLINPERRIPFQATEVNHITNEMVAEAPTLKEVFPLFLKFIGEDVLVGHNIHSFDMKFIWKAAEELYGKTVSNDYIDTLTMARQFLPQLSHHKLVDIASYYNMSTEGAHRALQDCIMNQKCFERMGETWKKQAHKECPMCGGFLQKRQGRYGAFWGCGNFPQCRYTENYN